MTERYTPPPSSEPNRIYGTMWLFFLCIGLVLAGIHYLLPLTNAVPGFLQPLMHHR